MGARFPSFVIGIVESWRVLDLVVVRIFVQIAQVFPSLRQATHVLQVQMADIHPKLQTLLAAQCRHLFALRSPCEAP